MSDSYKVLGIDIGGTKIAVCIADSEGNVLAVTKGETELIEAINKILDEVNEKGLYKQWKDDATELAKSLGIDVN